jgi:hypothetical protein
VRRSWQSKVIAWGCLTLKFIPAKAAAIACLSFNLDLAVIVPEQTIIRSVFIRLEINGFMPNAQVVAGSIIRKLDDRYEISDKQTEKFSPARSNEIE